MKTLEKMDLKILTLTKLQLRNVLSMLTERSSFLRLRLARIMQFL